jgi:indole-3-glycerol phosphate synthase
MRDIGGTILERIVRDTRGELDAARRERPLADLRRMTADAPPVRSFAQALRPRFCLVAEIKERSPSQGPMRPENVSDAPAAYERSALVRALSVLTNATHFGMSIDRLRQVRLRSTKPVLRKDFIFDDYQVWEARAFGADAVLLMANLLEREELRRLFDSARALGMQALFECHSREQIEAVPDGAEVYGINSRSFASGGEAYEMARRHRQAGGQEDFTTDLRQFALVRHLSAQAVKVAESGVSVTSIVHVRDALAYHAALVGTSLLLSDHGPAKELERFEQALAAAPVPCPAPHHR